MPKSTITSLWDQALVCNQASPGRRALHRLCLGLLCGLLFTGCNAAPHPVPPSPTATPLPPSLVTELTDANLSMLIVAEREAAITGDLPLLAALWAEDARIVDGRDTATPDDDFVWQGRAAILDRYELAVFPAPPPPLDPEALAATEPQIDHSPDTRDQALAVWLTNGDRWQLVQRDGRWWLYELVYSTP